MQSAINPSFTRSACRLLLSGLLALAVGACSTPPKTIPEADVLATPAGVRHEMRFIYTQDNTRLFRQAWIPEEGKAKGVLVVVHGFKDHGGRYFELGQYLAQRGFAVFAADLRGHGRSDGPRQMVESFNDYMVDLALVVRQVRTQFPGSPVFLLGHDVGGVITARFAEMIPNSIQGLALSGATLSVDDPKYKQIGVKVLAAVMPSAPVKRPDLKLYSRDQEAVLDLLHDPLVTQSGIPAKTVAEGSKAIQTLQEQTARLTMPLLVMHGVSDGLSPLYGSIALYDAAASKTKVLKQYPDMAHDIWHESGTETVMADLTDWLNGLVNR